MSRDPVLLEIQTRLHFVPPFFEPAAANPAVLANLWHQTKSAYLDNPLPDLFKEKLAALLGRYCEVPYCLVCHTCTLRPLGMGGPAIVDLLRARPPFEEQILAAVQNLDERAETVAFPLSDPAVEQDLFALGSAIYSGGPLAARARACLRRSLSADDYQSFVVFVSYNRMCHEWIAAHPEISYELDQRYLQNYSGIEAEAPAIAEFIGRLEPSRRPADESAEPFPTSQAEDAVRSVEISERRFVEVLRNLNASLSAATQQVSEGESVARKLQSTSDFAQELLAIVGHDLRNPLNTVLMGAEIAARTYPEDARITRPLKRVVAAARRAERMIHDLLDFSQARAGGGIPIHLRSVDLHELVCRTVDEIALSHPEAQVRLVQEGDGTGEFDSDRMTQAISNLLGNAVSHGAEGVPIDLVTRAEAEKLTIEIGNTNKHGPIPEELLPVLFDPFRRGVARAISRSRSIGLGLYIVDQIVKGHRGRVSVASSADSDSTSFLVELPRTGSSPAL